MKDVLALVSNTHGSRTAPASTWPSEVPSWTAMQHTERPPDCSPIEQSRFQCAPPQKRQGERGPVVCYRRPGDEPGGGPDGGGQGVEEGGPGAPAVPPGGTTVTDSGADAVPELGPGPVRAGRGSQSPSSAAVQCSAREKR